MLSVTCDKCGAAFFVPQDQAGQEVKCGTCGRMVKAPDVDNSSSGGAAPVEGAWEYMLVADRGRLGKVDQAKLNELGMQGWELVTVYSESAEAHTTYYFKRPYQS